MASEESAPQADANAPSRFAAPVLMSLVFLSMIGTGIVIPLLPFYAHVFQAPAWQVTLMFSGFAGGQFFGELIWGRLSDRIGRKPVVIGTILASSTCYIALAFAPNIWAGVLARTVAGVFSGNISVIQGYMVDVSPPERVAARLGLIGSVLGLGFIVGPTLGGALAHPELGMAGFRPPLLTAAALGYLGTLGAAVFVRESRRGGQSGARRGPIAALRHALTDAVLRRLMSTTLFLFGGFSAMWSSFGLWGAARFGWGPKEIGAAMAATGVVSALSQGLLSGMVTRRLGASRTVLYGLTLSAVFMFCAAAGPPEWLATPVVVLIVAFHTLTQPANATLISAAAPADEQGATLGANNATSALSRVAGPALAGLVFSTIGPWSAFVLSGVSLLLGAAVSVSADKAMRRRRAEVATAEMDELRGAA